MPTVLEITLPVFALVFCGFAGAWLRLLPEKAVEGINAFVFWFALPAMLLRVVGTTPLSTLVEPRFIAAYVATGLLLFFATMRAVRAGWIDPARRDSAHSTAYALNAVHGNVGYMGLALVAEVDRTLLPIAALTVVCDIFVLITLATALLEVQSHPDRHQGLRVARTVASGLLRSPLVMSLLAGFLLSLSGLALPATLDNFTRMLSNAAGPCALFAIGAALGGQRMRVDRPVALLAAIKLVVHPLLAALLLFAVFGVEHRAAAVGVLCACLPAASNTFIIAQRYELETREISASILGGTFAALVTVSLAIWLLGLR